MEALTPTVDPLHKPRRRGRVMPRMGQKFIDTLYAPDIRHKALYGGRGSGKSWSVATYLVSEAAKHRKRIVCARQFQNSIRDSSKELIEKRIRDMGLENQFTITDRYIIHNTTKSQFIFVGLERNIESIRSLEGSDVVWVEEARTINSRSLEILLPTVRQAGSQLIWTWNPEQPTDPVDAYFRQGQPPPRSIITRVSFIDNPYFKETEMPAEMEILRQGNFARYQHVWEGAYDVRYETKVFPNATIGRVDIPTNVVPRYGLDLGFGPKDPHFMVKVYIIDELRTIYIAAEVTGHFTMDQLPSVVRSLITRDEELITVDSSQPGTIEFLQARGVNVTPAKKGPGSIKTGINFMQGYKIVIDPDCEAMQEEARMYSWVTDRMTGQVSSVPIDAYNHGWDACRYAVEDATLASLDAEDDGGVLKLKLW